MYSLLIKKKELYQIFYYSQLLLVWIHSFIKILIYGIIKTPIIYNIDFINCISFSCVSMISFANFFNLGLLVLLYILCDVVNAVE